MTLLDKVMLGTAVVCLVGVTGLAMSLGWQYTVGWLILCAWLGMLTMKMGDAE